MLGGIKALIVILVLATPVLVLARPLCLRFMAEEDFRSRRLAWFVITVAAFISPSFWLYALIAIPFCISAGRKDSNPVALYMILRYAAPAVLVEVPKVISLNQHRLLACCLLIPAMLRDTRSTASLTSRFPQERPNTWMADLLLFAYCTLQVTPYLRSDSVTSILRREAEQMLDVMVPYLAISRTQASPRRIAEAMAAFVLSCAVMAPIGVFESAKGWLLYVEHADYWGVSANLFAYLMRADQLRAQAAAGHSLSLGLLMAMSFGFCLQLLKHEKSRMTYVAVLLLMWAGLLAAYSRGPWITALLTMFVYFWLMPQGTRRVLKVALTVAILAALLYPTSLGQRVVDSLPFVGHVDSGNVEYRQKLLDVALDLIPRHPWFGDLFVEQQMESLRQGQGIIDVVNGYLLIALYFGLVPLTALVCFCLGLLWKTLSGARRVGRQDPDASSLGSNLAASLVGGLFFVWVGGFTSFFWILIGLVSAYARWATFGSRQSVAAG